MRRVGYVVVLGGCGSRLARTEYPELPVSTFPELLPWAVKRMGTAMKLEAVTALSRLERVQEQVQMSCRGEVESLDHNYARSVYVC
jgi:hypothetical protein